MFLYLANTRRRMKIYVGHSSSFDFRKELYEPLENLPYEFIFPHDKSDRPFNSKDVLKSCNLMIAEVSYPSISLGIEIGWANMYDVPIIFVHKKGAKVSDALKVVSKNFVEYATAEELVAGIRKFTPQ